jgi:peptidoglycan LD-endopeptidase LytH
MAIWRKTAITLVVLIIMTGVIGSQSQVIPVLGATPKDWNPQSFWYSPWGRSGVHKGIDIFAKAGTPVLAASEGVVIYTGTIAMGGNVVLMVSRNWHLYYYAHLQDSRIISWTWQNSGGVIGRVGTTGNAQGKPPHLHFAIISLIPRFSQYDPALPQAWKRLFYVDPAILLGD